MPPVTGPRHVRKKRVRVRSTGDTKSAADLGRAKRYARTPHYRKILRDVYDTSSRQRVSAAVGGAVEVSGRGRAVADRPTRISVSVPTKRPLSQRQAIAHALAQTPVPARVHNPVAAALLKLHGERVSRNREISHSQAQHDITRPDDLVKAARELGTDTNVQAMVKAAVERAKRETAGQSLKAQAYHAQSIVAGAAAAGATAKQKARELDPNAQRLNQKFRAQVLRILDYTARPLYATAGGIHAGLKGRNVLHAAGRGITGKDKVTYREVLHDVGIRGKGTGVAAFALDVAGDPTTYLTAGLGAEARSAAEGAYHAAMAGSRESIEQAAAKASEYALKRGVSQREARIIATRARHVAELRARSRAAQAGRAAEQAANSSRGLRAGVRVPLVVRGTRRTAKAVNAARRERVSLREGFRATPREGRNATVLLGNNITQALGATKAGRAVAESKVTAFGRRQVSKIAPDVAKVRSTSATPIIDELIAKSIGRQYRVTRHRLENEARAHVNSYIREIKAHGLDEEAEKRIVLAIDDGSVSKLKGVERTIAQRIVDDLAKLGDTEVGLGIRQSIRANYFPRLLREGQRATEDVAREQGGLGDAALQPLMGKMGSSGRTLTGASLKQRSVGETLRELEHGTPAQQELFGRYVTSIETPLLARATDSARMQALKHAQDRIAAELGREVTQSDLLDVGRLLDEARIYRKGRAGFRFLALEDRDAAKAIRNYLDAKQHGILAQERKAGIKQAKRDLAAARTAAKAAVRSAERTQQVDLRQGLRKEASLRQALGEATGRAEVGSRNVAGVVGERQATAEASRGRGAIRKLGKNATPAQVLRHVQDLWERGAHSFAAGGQGVMTKEALLEAHRATEQLKRQANEALIKQAKDEGAAGVKHAQRVLEEVTKTKTIPSGTLVVIPPASFDRAFVHMGRGRSAPGSVNHWRAYDWLLGKTKTFQTVLNAPFFMTNMLGDTFNAKLADLDFGSMLRLPSLRMRLTEVERAQQALERDAGHTLLGQTKLGHKLPENFRVRPIKEGVRERYPVYGELSDLDVVKKAIEFGAVRTGQFGQEIKLLEAERGIEKAGEGKFLGPVRHANEWREDIMRLGLFYDRLKKGDTYEQAVDVVNKHLFDYGDLTDFERQVLRRLIPYYTFFARNTRLQGRMVFGKPGTYAAVESARVESAKSSDLNPNFAKVMAVYDQAGAPFILPTVKVNGDPVTVYAKLPLTDLSNFDVNPAYQWRNLVTRAASPIKSVVEQTTGRNLFFDQQYPSHVTAPAFFKTMLDLSPLPPGLKSHAGYIEGKDSGLYNPRTGKWDPGYNWRIDEVARNIPMYSTAANIFKAATTPAGTGQRTAGLPFLLAGQVLGPRTGVYDPTEVARTQVGQRISDLMKEREDVLRRRIPGAHERTHGRLREIQDELQKLYGVKYKLEKRAGFKHPGGKPPAKKKRQSYGFSTSSPSKKNPYGF